VPAQGGETRPVSRRVNHEKTHVVPSFLPDQRHFLFLSSVGHWRIGSLAGESEVPVPIKASPAVYASTGYLLFVSDGNILARPFDPKRARFSGEAVIVGGPVQQWGNIGFYPFSASDTGVLAWLDDPRISTQLVWVDAAGNRLGTVGEPADYTSPALSPDGGKLAVAMRDPATQQRDIWIFDLARGSRARFTFDPADDLNPVWSPDGSRIAWTSDRTGKRNLYVKPASGTGQDQLLYESSMHISAEQWSPDGKYLVFNSKVQRGTGAEIAALPLTPGVERKPIPLVQGRFTYERAQLSSDGRFLAYCSTESGAEEIYVQPFPPTGAKWQVSASGGSEAFWSQDGKQLFYISGSTLMRAPVNAQDRRFDVGISKPLFVLQLPVPARNRIVWVGNGRFLVNMPISHSAPGNTIVLLNWPALLKR